MNILQRFAHAVLDWHTPVQAWVFDGFSMTSKCKVCGQRIIQDSHGQWFSVEREKA